MYAGEWIGSSLGFIVVMLGAMLIGVGLVAYAAVATMRGLAADDELETSPALAADQPSGVPAPAPARLAMAPPVAVSLAD